MSKSGSITILQAACLAVLAVIGDAMAAPAGSTFVFALRGKAVQSLNPTDAFSTNHMAIEAQILEGLMRFDPRKPEQEPQRNLAYEHYMIDPVTYVFRLRKDAYFHPFKNHPKDRLTPDDVRFSLERAKTSLSPLAMELREIQSIETVGSDLVKIKLNRANRNFLATLATSIGHITSRTYFESLGPDEPTRTRAFNRLPIGTGPYRLAAPLSPNANAIVLERFDQYRDRYWVRSPASLQSVTFRFYDDPKAILQGIADDQVAMANLPLTEYGDGVNVSAGKGSLTLLSPPFLVILAINTAKPPLNDILVRQLFNAAVHTPNVLKICHADPGELPAGFQYYMQIPQQFLEARGVESIARMLAVPTTREALQRVRKTGIKILAPAQPDHIVDKILEAVAADLRRNLDIDVRIEKTNSMSIEEIDRTQADLIYAQWTPDTPWQHTDASILKPLFYSRSRYNLGRYKDSEVDRLFQQIRVFSDPSTTEKNYGAIQRRLIATAPLIWLPSVRHTTLFLKKGYEAPYVIRPDGGPSSTLLYFTSMVKDIRRTQ